MYSSLKSTEWDRNAAILSLSITASTKHIGFSEYFANEALNYTIPNCEINKEIIICDIGTGVGALPLYAIKKYKNAKIIAIDFSSKMIEVIDKHLKKNSIENIKTLVLDCHDLNGIIDSSIDYIYSLFSVIYFQDRIRCMKEMHRTLKEGGKTAISSWCTDSFIPLCLQLTMNELLGNESFKQPSLSLSDPIVFESELKQAGFKNIEIKRVEHSMQVSNIQTLLKILKSNPIYLDCVQAIDNQKKELFNELFIKNANLQLNQHPQSQNQDKLILKSYSYIGIGTK